MESDIDRAQDNFFQQGDADSSLCDEGVFLQHLVVFHSPHYSSPEHKVLKVSYCD